MSILTLKAKQDHLQSVASTRDYIKALSEFVWNSLDADATDVSVEFYKNNLGGLESVIIRDNGTGISKVRAEHDFESLGESWKLKTTRTPKLAHAIHGKEGRGRLRFFSISHKARWISVYKLKDDLVALTIEIKADALANAQVSDPLPAQDANGTGTVVELVPLKDTFDWLSSDAAMAEFNATFAPYVLQYPNTKISYNDSAVDPDTIIEQNYIYPPMIVDCPTGTVRDLVLRIIEWKDRSGARKIYFGGESGLVLGSQAANVVAPDFAFSVYAYSSFFQELAKANLLDIAGINDPDFTFIIEHIREVTGDYFRQRQAEKTGELIQDLKAAGLYPYTGDPRDEVERQERQVFDIATHAVSSYSKDFKKADNSLKKITLGLLREAVSHNPDSISRILHAVFNLPKFRQDEFSALLDRTELANIIAASSLIADRVVVLQVLREMVFNPAHRGTIKERGELDVLIRDNAWIFGENFHLTMSEAGLTKIMERVSDELVIRRTKGAKLKKPDGSRGRVDSFMGRVVPHSKPLHREFLLVELKRPSLTVGRKELDQLEDYVGAILSQPDFIGTSTFWNFYLVTTMYDEVTQERVTQKDRPAGLFIDKPNHRVWVKSWSELILEAESRIDFVQKKLQIEVSAEEITGKIDELKSSFVKMHNNRPRKKTPPNMTDVREAAGLAL